MGWTHSMNGANPYNEGTFEHQLWEDWNREFFHQPVHAQLLEIEQEMRGYVRSLAELLQQLDENEVKRALVQKVLAVELTAERVSEMAEHQYLAVVSRTAKPDGN